MEVNTTAVVLLMSLWYMNIYIYQEKILIDNFFCCIFCEIQLIV